MLPERLHEQENRLMDAMAAVNSGPLRPLRIVLPGGSGQVGQVLARYFQQRGHQVTVLTRGPYAAPWQTVHWDGEQIGPWTEYLEGADVCINLAGRSVNCRYSAANRQAIYDSRIRSTRLLGRVIAGLSEPPRLWMNASAATIYRRVLDETGVDLPLDEAAELDEAAKVEGGDKPAANAPPAATGLAAITGFSASMALLASLQPQSKMASVNPSAASKPTKERWLQRRGFSARVARDWEAAFFAAQTPLTRKVALRSAVVLSPTPSSAFAVLSHLVRLSFGGKQGSGRQFVSWIHEADYARAVEFLISREDLEGPVNLAAPHPLTNREFMAALREAWDVPNGLPAPWLAIQLGAFFLRTEPELVLQSCRAVPGRLLEAGFEFQFPAWPEAAEDLVRRWKSRE
jgi:NAD dependent epimerase/dehydratase family enzyme